MAFGGSRAAYIARGRLGGYKGEPKRAAYCARSDFLTWRWLGKPAGEDTSSSSGSEQSSSARSLLFSMSRHRSWSGEAHSLRPVESKYLAVCLPSPRLTTAAAHHRGFQILPSGVRDRRSRRITALLITNQLVWGQEVTRRVGAVHSMRFKRYHRIASFTNS
jgi:hypothetical protein